MWKDIDLDFDPFYKEKIMEKVREHFGAENVLNTITYKTESTKSAILTACFLKGQKVYTKEGEKNIEDVKTGDVVLTSDGEQPVITPTFRKYSGDIYKIKTSNTIDEGIYCTHNHQFLISPSKNKRSKRFAVGNWHRCGLYDKNKNLLGKFNTYREAARFGAEKFGLSFSTLDRFHSHENYYIEDIDNPSPRFNHGEPRWMCAEEIEKGDFMYTPVPKNKKEKNTEIIYFGEEEQNPYKKGVNFIKEKILIDDDFKELLGIFLAEGNINHNQTGITFTINIKETALRDRIILLLDKVFDLSKDAITFSRKKDSKGFSIQCNSSPLGRFFHKYVYNFEKLNAHTKRVPDFLFRQPQSLLPLVKGFYLGDGYCRIRGKHSREAKLTTVSKKLASQLWEIIASNGYCPTCITENRKSVTYNIMLYGKNAELLYNIKYSDNSIEEDFVIQEKSAIKKYYNNYYYLSRVVQVEKYKEVTNEEVHCLSTPAENFVIGNVIAHNCRGLEIPVEEAQVLSSMVPMIRGRVLPLDTCINGDEENEAVNGFKEALQKHPNLETVIRKIEGLISGRGVHASSVYIFNNGYLAQNSLMRAPNGLLITAYNMHQSDSMGALKMDFLYTEAQSKIGVCLKLLLDDKMINWQGDLYNTYRKYLHPDVIDYDNQEMWDKVSNNEIPDLFQFDTQVGLECAKKVKPHNLNELTLANSVMRLMGDGKEKPIDRFARFKSNINEWYEEMQKEGLTEEEQELAKKVLGNSYGCSIEQETLMVGAMEIAGFSLKDANSLRKIVSKKLLKKIPEMKELFFKANARKEFLEYMWKVLIEPQLGYAFSRNHCLAYSMEAVQEMNLATKYPSIYWACACLTVNAKQGVAGDEDVGEISSGGTSDYGKISRAISKMQLQHIKVELPDINKSAVDFKPDNETNSILFGFGGLKGVSTDYFKEIIDNRPYNSYKDFYDRVSLPTAQMFALIKSGAFSKIESKSRKELLIDYLNYEMDKNKSFNKDKLTMANFGRMVEGNCIPEKFIDISKMYYFKQWLEDNAVNSDKTSYTISEDTPVRFFLERCAPFLKQEDYNKVEDVYTVSYKKFKKFYDNYMEEIKDWLNTTEAVECYNKLVRQTNIDTLFEKYCQGTDAHLDMDSLGYYYSRHELSNVRYGDYGGQPITISNFEDLPLHKEKDKYYYLAGTVIDVNKNKKTVALLTPECGVVDVKFYDTLFINYNKKIAVTDKNGKKTVVEDSWLQKGSTIIVNGTRNENTFMCAKSYSFSRFTVALITDITESGSCKLTFKRKE